MFLRDFRNNRKKKQEGQKASMDKKNILTYQGLQKLEEELQNLKVVRRKEVAQKSTMQRKTSSVTLRLVSKISRRS